MQVSKNCRENFTSLENIGETIEIEVNVFYFIFLKKFFVTM